MTDEPERLGAAYRELARVAEGLESRRARSNDEILEDAIRRLRRLSEPGALASAAHEDVWPSLRRIDDFQRDVQRLVEDAKWRVYALTVLGGALLTLGGRLPWLVAQVLVTAAAVGLIAGGVIAAGKIRQLDLTAKFLRHALDDARKAAGHLQPPSLVRVSSEPAAELPDAAAGPILRGGEHR